MTIQSAQQLPIKIFPQRNSGPAKQSIETKNENEKRKTKRKEYTLLVYKFT